MRGLKRYQREILVKRFQGNPYPQEEEKHQISRLINISRSRIEQWFNTKRKYTKSEIFMREDE